MNMFYKAYYNGKAFAIEEEITEEACREISKMSYEERELWNKKVIHDRKTSLLSDVQFEENNFELKIEDLVFNF